MATEIISDGTTEATSAASTLAEALTHLRADADSGENTAHPNRTPPGWNGPTYVGAALDAVVVP